MQFMPKLGSVATNRFVYRKLLGGLGGFYPVPFGVPLWVSFTDFGFCIWEFTNLYSEIAISKPWVLVRCFAVLCRLHFSLSKTLSLVSRIVFIIAAVTRSCLVSKLRCFLNSCDSLYHSHVHADHFNYSIPRSLGSQSFCYPPSASLVSLSRFIATSFGSLRTFTYGGGYACVVSVSRFALLRAFGWSVCGLNLWISRGIHPIFDKKEVRIFPMLFALVSCDSCFDFSDVCTFISVPRWHTACPY